MNPTQKIKVATNQMLADNGMENKTAAEVYLGNEMVVVRLREPKIIEGQWSDVEDNKADIMDLIDDYKKERK